MSNTGELQGIKTKSDIYYDAGLFLEEGRLFPFIVNDLAKKYNAGPEMVSKLVADAQGKHWDHLQERVLELVAENKTYPEMVALLNEEEPDGEIVKYIIGRNYGLHTQAEEKKITERTPIAETALLLIAISTILFVFYHDNAYGIFKIVGWVFFAGALLGFINSLNSRSHATEK